MLRTVPDFGSVLDVGCGTGYLLRILARRCLSARWLDGIDPAPSMVEVAAAQADDSRLNFVVGVAEQLPYPDESFDLIVSTTSFDHWADQGAGLRECARVLRPGGRLLLVDLFSLWLTPTLLAGRRGNARTKARAAGLLAGSGLRPLGWHDLYAVIINAVGAAKLSIQPLRQDPENDSGLDQEGDDGVTQGRVGAPGGLASGAVGVEGPPNFEV